MSKNEYEPKQNTACTQISKRIRNRVCAALSATAPFAGFPLTAYAQSEAYSFSANTDYVQSNSLGFAFAPTETSPSSSKGNSN